MNYMEDLKPSQMYLIQANVIWKNMDTLGMASFVMPTMGSSKRNESITTIY